MQSPRVGRFEPADFFCRNLVGNGSVPVVRRAALDRIAFMDEARGRVSWFDEDFKRTEDIECWLRMRVIGNFRFGYIGEPLTGYRVNSSGLVSDVDAQFATWVQFRDKVATLCAGSRRALRRSLRSLPVALPRPPRRARCRPPT